jgi:hypothetical protein
MGIPAHPLLVHAAVIFIPLQLIGAIVYVLFPVTRSKITWAVVALAVVGPASAWAAKKSGEAFRNRLITRDHARIGSPLLTSVDQHFNYGTWTAWLSLVLGLVTLVVVWIHRTPRPVSGQDTAEIAQDAARVKSVGVNSALASLVGTVAVIILGVATAYFVFRTGDTGAHIVWQNM